MSFDLSGERGLFVVEGAPLVSYGSSESTASEGDIIYVIGEEGNGTPVVRNTSDKEIILTGIELKDKSLERFALAQRRKFKAILVDIDGVITNPYTKRITPEALQRLIMLLRKGIPVCLASGRKHYVGASDRALGIRSVDEVANDFREALKEIGREDLLDYLFISSENGAVIANAYAEKDKRIRIIKPPA